MRWLFDYKQKGNKFNELLFSLIGWRVYISGRYTGNDVDGLSEYKITIYYFNKLGHVRWLIKP